MAASLPAVRAVADRFSGTSCSGRACSIASRPAAALSARFRSSRREDAPRGVAPLVVCKKGASAPSPSRAPPPASPSPAPAAPTSVSPIPSTPPPAGARINNVEEVEEERFPLQRIKWSAAQDMLRPTQAALGWDWCFSKLDNFRTAESAQAYMDRKPVPFLQRGKLKYVVDHHHTLCALAMSGWDPEITLQEVSMFKEEERSLEAFWGYMEGRGWAFMRDEKYQRLNYAQLPTRFAIEHFRNDVYRSMGGFARTHGILKRGTTLEDRLFFEFRWGYFFWLHRDNDFGLWPDGRLHRGWWRLLHLVDDIDMQEYMLAHNWADVMERTASVENMIFLSKEVIEPAYKMLAFYLRHLAWAYDAQDGKARDVPGLKEIFGSASAQLPGRVLRDDKEQQLVLPSKPTPPGGKK